MHVLRELLRIAILISAFWALGYTAAHALDHAFGLSDGMMGLIQAVPCAAAFYFVDQ